MKTPHVLPVLALVLWNALGLADCRGETAATPEICLTLIPPSLVTAAIRVDVRAGITNRSNAREELSVAFFLDREQEASLLFRKEVSLDAHASTVVRFRWPTSGRAGAHKILVVAAAGEDVFRAEQSLCVIASQSPSPKLMNGAFVDFYHWSESEGQHYNRDLKKLTDDQWKRIVDDMHQLKMDTIVIQEVFRNQMYYGKHTIIEDGYRGLAFFPSELYPERMPIAAKDPVEAVLAQADQNGMHVLMGVGLYAWFDFTPGSLAWHKRAASELWKKYGHHPSFYGWYVCEEIEGGLGNAEQRQDILAFFPDFQAHVRKLAPGKPVMLATNCHNLRGAEETYHKLLPHIDILCPFGFERMPKGDLTGREAASKLQSLCDRAGTHLWMDLEAFSFEAGNALAPRPANQIVDALNQFAQFEQVLCYAYTGMFNSPEAPVKPGGDRSVKLFLGYKSYLKESLKWVTAEE